MDNPLIYIIVLNYCSFRDTLGCIESLRNIDYPNLHLLIIDNASPDDEGQKIKNQLRNEEFIQLPRNTGYAGGNNIGIKHALEKDADYILVVNPDIRMTPTSIQDYIEIFKYNDEIGALNPVQLCDDGFSIDPKFVNTIFKPLGHKISTLEEIPQEKVLYTSDLLGAAIMFPRITLEKVGGFDPLYFAYSEEADLCRRIRFHGFKLATTSLSPVKHLRTRENKGVSDFVLFLRLKGICLFTIKNPRLAFLRGVSRAANFLWRGFRGKAKDQYPFKFYPVRKKHIIKTALWLIVNLPLIWLHRRTEIRGRAHI